MTQSKPRFLNFDDYLIYDDGTDKLYELFNSDSEALLQSADRIISPLFSELALTVEQVLAI